VWGKVYKAAELKQLEHQLKMQQEQNIFNAFAMEHREEIMAMRRNRDREGLMALQERLGNMAIAKSKELGAPTFTPEQVEAYTTLGGTPFLDGGYTVFGEVTEGLDIVEKIQNTQTSPNDRPKSDIAMEVTVMEA
jgi:peptidyl-prolyl cis-trans isomerase B (cyclophilin B)